MLDAAQRADQLLKGAATWLGAETWHKIFNAIERVQAMKLSEDEAEPRAALMWEEDTDG